MNRTPKSVTSLIKLALALSLLGWMAFACGVTIPIFSHRVVSAAAGLPFEMLPQKKTFAIISRPDLSNFAIPANHKSSIPMPQARGLRVRDMSAAPGSRLTVPVELFAEGNERVVQFSLRFDPGSLDFVGAELGRDAVGAHLILDYAQAAAGILGVTIELPSERQFETGNNRLLDLSFNLSEDLARSSV